MPKIISGGQTGADRAALEFALANGIPHGGWCPKDRWAEDGPIDPRFHLVETPGADPAQRTEWNVRDSDGVVIFSIHPVLLGGSKLTAEFAAAFDKPCLHLSRERDHATSAVKLSRFLAEHQVYTLNVAGSRASEELEIAEYARHTLQEAVRF
jgi:hypothetical protein